MKRIFATVLSIALLTIGAVPAQATGVGSDVIDLTALAPMTSARPTSGTLPAVVDGDYSSGAMVTDPGCFEKHIDVAGGYANAYNVQLGFQMTINRRTFSAVTVSGTGGIGLGPYTEYFWLGNDTLSPTSEVSFPADLISPHALYSYAWGPGVAETSFGQITYDGRPALCVTWTNQVIPDFSGDFVAFSAPPNRFQLLLVGRSDSAPGDVDVIFNYDTIRNDWDYYGTGEYDEWSNTWYENSWSTARIQVRSPEGAVPGYTEGGNWGYPPANLVYSFNMEGVGIPGAFVDTSPTGLAIARTNSDQPGRHVFEFRGGYAAVNPLIPGTPVSSDPGDDGDDDDIELPDGFPIDYDPLTYWLSYEHFLEVDTYVALGDSYQSGEGSIAANYYPLTQSNENRCHRSLYAYPVLLRNSGLFGTSKFEFWACSDAVVEDFYSTATATGEAPWNDPDQLDWTMYGSPAAVPQSQLDRLTESTAVVTLGIGGNDLEFADILKDCVHKSFLRQLVSTAWTYSCAGAYDQRVEELKADLLTNPQYLGLIGEIRERSPHASIIVLGYPRFFPVEPEWNLHWETAATCNSFTAADQIWLNETVEDFNSIIKRVAESRGATYVDIYDAGDYREICSAQWGTDQWFMNGIVQAGKAESFHPNELGHELIFQQIERSLHAQGWDGGAQVIYPEETKVYQTTVPPALEAYFSLTWPGSDIQLTLTSPSGIVYSRADTSQAASHVLSETSESFVIADPEPGEWTVTLTALHVNPLGEPFVLQNGFTEFPNAAPVPSFTLTQSGRTIHVDASASNDADGVIASYEWDFGDGPAVSGAQVSHTFEGTGNRDVTLIVTDDRGERSYLTHPTPIEIPEYAFGGFTGPWGHRPAAEWARAGLPIPLGFDLGKNWGNDILEPGSPTVQQVSCSTGVAVGSESSALSSRGTLPTYNRWTDRYVWVWETKSAWAGTCQQLTFDFNDGSSASLTVRFLPRFGFLPWRASDGWNSSGFRAEYHPAHHGHNHHFWRSWS